MSSIAQANQIAKLEEKVAALEAVFLRSQIEVRSQNVNTCESCTCKPDLEKMKNDIQGLKMRMGKVKSE